MEQLSENATNILENNRPKPANGKTKQGHFILNGYLLISFHKTKNDNYLLGVIAGYAEIFGEQKKVYDNQQISNLIHKMRINHPNVTVLMD